MEYALYNGSRSEARPGLRGVCEHCGSTVIAKCGSKIVWHWAHESVEACDSWYEPETAWHRNWKQLFGERYSEIRVQKDDTYHIADVLNQEGIVFEFQNSSISAAEIALREDFYGEKMVWVINGESFRNNFVMYDDAFINGWQVTVVNEFDTAIHYRQFRDALIVDAQQITQEPVKQLLKTLGFLYVSEAHIYHKPVTGVTQRKVLEQEIFEEVFVLYEKQRQDNAKGKFSWTRPRRSWEDAGRPVFIDFGSDDLYRITEGMGREQGRGTRVSRERFLAKYCKMQELP